MRGTKANEVRHSSQLSVRALRIGAVALAVGFVMMTGAARAQEDEDDDKTFEEKIIEGVMAGIGGTNMDNRGIDYRERSPLVVPPKLDLPPPQTAATEVKAPNWPKDPDEARRKAMIAKRNKDKRDTRDATQAADQAARPLSPSELNVGKTAAPAVAPGQVVQPGQGDLGQNAILSPSQLGYSGGFSGLFGGNKAEIAPFKGEPTRDSLTQPPVGYQTPSPNFAYGTGPKESLNKEYNPAAGKYGE
jgi:type IV secretory pathway VirB10-like protein